MSTTTNQLDGDPQPMGLTVEEAATMLGVSRAHAYRLVADGSLASIRLHRRILVPRAAIIRLFENAEEGRKA